MKEQLSFAHVIYSTLDVLPPPPSSHPIHSSSLFLCFSELINDEYIQPHGRLCMLLSQSTEVGSVYHCACGRPHSWALSYHNIKVFKHITE